MSLETAVSEPANMRELEIVLREARRRRRKEELIERFFFLTGLTAILVLGGIFALLFIKAYPAFKELGIFQFFTGAVWNPTSYSTPRYGILSLIVSSLMVTLGALVVAVPLGIGCAAFISEMASKRF